MSNSFLFDTDGTWDHTSLLRNGEQIDASRIYVSVRTERNHLTDKVKNRSVEATISPLTVRGDKPVYGGPPEDLLPGRVEMTFPRGTVILTSEGHAFDPMKVRIEFEGIDVTESVDTLGIDVDSPRDSVTAFITLFQGSSIPMIGHDQVNEIDLLG